MKDKHSDLESRTRSSSIALGGWTLAWVLSMALTAFGPRFLWDFDQTLSIIAVVVNLLIGFKMLWANKQHLAGLDEMQRSIQLNAMAITLGVGLVVGLAYEILEDIKLIGFEPEIPHLIILMSVVHMIGLVAGRRRYQ